MAFDSDDSGRAGRLDGAQDGMKDALVVGGGPAGLGAALALCRMNHSVVVFDTGAHRNQASGAMHMVSTWDHRLPDEFRANARAELTRWYPGQCSFVDREVLAVRRLDDASGDFEATDAGRGVWTARKVILATGSRVLLPMMDGLDACWDAGVVVHCLLCHGHEHRDAEPAAAAVLALDASTEPATVLRLVRSCRQLAARVCVFTNGNARAAAQLREAAALVPGTSIEPTAIQRLETVGVASQGLRLVLEGGAVSPVYAFAVYRPATEQASSLPERLGLDLDADGDISLGALQETSVHGIFAAGDCASRHKYVSVASASGHMAGAGAAQQLQAERKYT